MEYTEKDTSEFVMNLVDINHRPLKFLELNIITTLQLIKKGYEVIVSEDETTKYSSFYSLVVPPESEGRWLIDKIKNKIKSV